MSVAVVIVNWNSGAFLDRCLRALESQHYSPQKVIIVDNASSDDSLKAADKTSLNLSIIQLADNAGFAKANNIAVAECTAVDWIATLNADAFPEPDWLAELMQTSEQNPEYVFFASCMLKDGNVELYDGAGDDYFISGLAKRRHYLKPFVAHENVKREVFAPCAAAALYNRKAWEVVQGFDEDFFCFFEDVDLGFRLRLKGYKCLYVPQAVVRHVGGGLTSKISGTVVMYGHRNLVWTFFKNMPLPLMILTLPFHFIINVISIAYFMTQPQRMSLLSGKWQAVKGLPRFLAKRKQVQKNRISSRKLLQSMTWRLW